MCLNHKKHLCLCKEVFENEIDGSICGCWHKNCMGWFDDATTDAWIKLCAAVDQANFDLDKQGYDQGIKRIHAKFSFRFR